VYDGREQRKCARCDTYIDHQQPEHLFASWLQSTCGGTSGADEQQLLVAIDITVTT
jgi:hypothetical protein